MPRPAVAKGRTPQRRDACLFQQPVGDLLIVSERTYIWKGVKSALRRRAFDSLDGVQAVNDDLAPSGEFEAHALDAVLGSVQGGCAGSLRERGSA